MSREEPFTSRENGKNRGLRRAAGLGHHKNLSLPGAHSLYSLPKERTAPKTSDSMQKPEGKSRDAGSIGRLLRVDDDLADQPGKWAEAPVFIPQRNRPEFMEPSPSPAPSIAEQIDAMEANCRQICNMLRASYENNGAETPAPASDGASVWSEGASSAVSVAAAPPPATLFEWQQTQQLLEAMAHGDAPEAVHACRKNLIRTWIEMGVLEAKK
ncbi:uncharacterized protein BDZ99DRAFT_523777 [Mytilinidion resinicola]|uniref:Uncharacterized protein n=1 Tax=Mytilinidion resinicola TaxID=574789 RepID=A0A6A6YBW7_9PEZI|nr:uncharacterized protein BDZ99DRAFT_523777 [Mytilinidion resinicola]KAF2806316.1 hypothetical protein BDZ99DRAFT_523777 [Mytilinidion resinicola]